MMTTINYWSQYKQKVIVIMILPGNYTFLPIGSIVAVQWKDRDRCPHGIIVVKGNHNHNSRSYTIHITNTG